MNNVTYKLNTMDGPINSPGISQSFKYIYIIETEKYTYILLGYTSIDLSHHFGINSSICGRIGIRVHHR